MKITEPGLVRDLPNETYHEQAEWVSSSMLKALIPERYKTGGSQDALDFGTLFHTAVLEPENLAEYVALDAAKIAGDNPKTGRPYDAPQMTAKFKAAAAEAAQDGRKVITQEWMDQALAMREAVVAHETANELLFNRDGLAEESAFAEVDGIKCRARFDKRIPGVILDLKSTSGKPGKESIAKSVIEYGYDLSAAHYLAVAEVLDLDAQAFGFVFVSKAEPYYVTVCDLDEAFLARGRALRALAIDRHRRAVDAYEGASGFLTLDLPRWAHLKESA